MVHLTPVLQISTGSMQFATFKWISHHTILNASPGTVHPAATRHSLSSYQISENAAFFSFLLEKSKMHFCINTEPNHLVRLLLMPLSENAMTWTFSCYFPWNRVVFPMFLNRACCCSWSICHKINVRSTTIKCTIPFLWIFVQWVQVPWSKSWIAGSATASLITSRPLWCLQHSEALTLTPHFHSPLENKPRCTGPKKESLPLKRYRRFCGFDSTFVIVMWDAAQNPNTN